MRTFAAASTGSASEERFLTQGSRPGGGLREERKKLFEKGLWGKKEFVPLSSLPEGRPLTGSVSKKSFEKGLQNGKACLPLQPASKEAPRRAALRKRKEKKVWQKFWNLNKSFRPLHPATKRTALEGNKKDTIA
ncbi:hypothetical protein [Pontibacter mucosus]|uniref:hypothetical protein n=1 Tax=Pontibacter mucosus TaxID=1649266 RepID=UPI000D369F7F|nr:hypothetical protein [Pontibacter mucosus]